MLNGCYGEKILREKLPDYAFITRLHWRCNEVNVSCLSAAQTQTRRMKPSFATYAHLSASAPIGQGGEENTVLHVFHQPIKAPNAFSISMRPYLCGVLRSAFKDVVMVDSDAKMTSSRDEK